LVEARFISSAFTEESRQLFLRTHEEALEEAFENTLVLRLVFEEILNQMASGGELAYYKRDVCAGNNDCLFF
jgi:hypothetical protein